ncbi:MAG: cytochrome c-type biogenesis CcmF C-terminal domain-containing protein [Melioribacteraceae bacterium]|nr:MAG: cytochrome c-type biogenesis CcmF C-terminal domain-containing protein [Melioribacteraceae bacterium]
MIGNIVLTIGLLASLFTLTMYYFTLRGFENTKNFARIGFHTTAIMVIAASALLLHAVLTHQYQYNYVYNYSGSGLPTGLLMSTFYAGQEGSFMLWVLLTSIVGLILLDYTAKRGDLEERTMFFFTLVIAFLLVMVNPLLKSPFNYIWADPSFINAKNINSSFLNLSFVQNFLFTDSSNGTTFVQMNKDLYALLTANGIAINDFIIQGKGLNPLLQNFWMQIHPPILFVGFSMATAPFAFAMAAIVKNEYTEWIKQSLPWILSGMMLLGLGIMLGGYWAYGVLGWGGYWGWDPVENSSLVPWIVGVALIHTMLIQKKSQSNGGHPRFVKTNLLLAVMTYVLVIYSTFLTRSGILGDASVHSFVSPGMLVYFFLVVFIGTFTIIGLGGIAYRWKYLNETFNDDSSGLSRELALFTGAVTLLASAIIVLVGTSAPIFGQSVEIRFYNEMNLPIGIIIGLLNGLSLLLKWKHTESNEIFKNSRNAIAGAVIMTALIVIFGGIHDIMMIIFTFSAAFALFVNGEIAFKILKGKKTHLGAYIAHIGIALFMLGVIATGGKTYEEQIDLVKGEPKSVLGYDLTFKGYTPIDNGKKFAFNIDIAKNGEVKNTISPVMYVADFNNSLMREPDILNMLTKDIYVSPLGYNDGAAQDHNHDQTVTIKKGSSATYENAVVTFVNFEFPEESMSSMMGGGSFQIGAVFNVEQEGKAYEAKAYMKSEGGNRTFVPADVPEANLKIDMINLDASGSVVVSLESLDGSDSNNSHASMTKETLSIEASVKPFINLVWAGVLIMVAGFTVSVVRRTKESKK